MERILAWYDRLKGLRFAALRYFNAAGYDARGRISGLVGGREPDESVKWWREIVYRAIGKGTAWGVPR